MQNILPKSGYLNSISINGVRPHFYSITLPSTLFSVGRLENMQKKQLVRKKCNKAQQSLTAFAGKNTRGARIFPCAWRYISNGVWDSKSYISKT